MLGKPLRTAAITRAVEHARGYVTSAAPCSRRLGFYHYLGPIDGHNLEHG